MYAGNILEIPLGQAGLRTDDPDSKMTSANLIKALNINLQDNHIEKDFGSRRWNSTVLAGGVRAAVDWWPDGTTQRLICLCSDGKVYRFENFYTSAEVGSSSGASATLNPSFPTMVTCGAEETGNPRKIFIFTGYDPIQVISGDGLTRSPIASPIPSWTGTNQPVYGVVHRSKLFVMLRDSSTVFASSSLDHENFLTAPLPYEVYPGESDRVSTLFVFRGKLFAMKYPSGLYVLNDSDSTASNWYFQKINGSVGASGPQCSTPVFDDVLFGNEYGSVSSLTATDQTGDVKSSDVFAQLRVQRFVRDFTNPAGTDGIRQAIYYKDRKTAMFTYRSKTATHNDLICNIDFSTVTTPRVVWNSKDQPSCLFLRKDQNGIERPFYGAEDGYLYAMDQPDRWVGSADASPAVAYTADFQTPYLDLSMGDSATSVQNKLFDWLEVKYLPCGKWNLNIDIFIDGYFHKTLQFDMGGNSDLDTLVLDDPRFGTDAEAERTPQKPLGGSGKRISFRCYNGGVGENVSVVSLTVGFRLAGPNTQKN